MDPVVGQKITGTKPVYRDALHVAIIPLVAGEDMSPGQKIKLKSPNTDIAVKYDPLKDNIHRDYIGVVDPMLHENVVMGERFYGFMKSGVVKGMRHHWDSNQFPTAGLFIKEEEEDVHYKYLKQHCESNSLNLEQFLETCQTDEDFMTTMRLEPDDYSMDDVFWYHLEQYTGMEFEDWQRSGPDWECMMCQ